jgi:hypothetical protein
VEKTESLALWIQLDWRTGERIIKKSVEPFQEFEHQAIEARPAQCWDKKDKDEDKTRAECQKREHRIALPLGQL